MTHKLVTRVKLALERRAYRKAMMEAITEASQPCEIWGACNRADGLRAIRAFEKLNGSPFDPFSPVQRSIVRGTGPKHRRSRFGRVHHEVRGTRR